MNFVVEPVVMPSINWDSLKRVVNNNVNAGSTAIVNERLRFIQDQNIGYGDPASLLIYLNGSRKAEQILDLIQLGFVFVIPIRMVVDFLINLKRSIRFFELGKTDETVTIFAIGNCKEWVLQIEHVCTEDALKELRIIFNEVSKCIERSRLKDFIFFKKRKLQDHTLEITCNRHG